MLINWAAKVVLLPSGASHFPLIVPPTPEAKGVFTTSFGLLSLNGVPKNPQTTGPLTPGATVGPAWTCAAIRLSLASADCAPVKSILLTVAVNVIASWVLLIENVATPYEPGRAVPPEVVGFVGGTSCVFVRFTTKRPGDIPALASSVSTYCAFVRLLGY